MDRPDATLQARAAAMAQTALPQDTDMATRQIYMGLLLKKFIKEQKPPVNQAAVDELRDIERRLGDIRSRAEKKAFKTDRERAWDDAAATGMAAFAKSPTFERYTKKGADAGGAPVRVISPDEVNAFLYEVKQKAAAKNIEVSFKQLFDLAAKKFGIARENLDAPSMAYVKAALLQEQAAEKQRVSDAQAAAREAVMIPEGEVTAFFDGLEQQGRDATDMLGLLEVAKKQFGVNASNLKNPRYVHLKRRLETEMVNMGYTDADSAGETLELLLS